MMVWGTVELVEILWTLSALPGLVGWLMNRVEAGRSRAAVLRLGYGNGRLTWARFSVLLTTVFSTVEAVFVLIGVIAMLRGRSVPAAADWTRPILTMALIGGSALITFVAWQWRQVDRELVALYRAQRRNGNHPSGT